MVRKPKRFEPPVDEIVYVERETVAVKVRISESIKKQRDERIENHECLGCEERFPREVKFVCGQCPKCYCASRRGINAHKVTEAELIREGKMLPPGKAGRRPSNPYTKMIAER